MLASEKFRNQILTKASQDEEFRTRLMEDPTDAIGTELDMKLPDGFDIRVHEDSASSVNLVLPPKEELSASDLEQVSGGSDNPMGDWDGWD